MKNFAAIIPVRGKKNQEILPNKDFLPFAGTNLLTHKIRQLKKIEGLKIIVSTENEYLAELARMENVQVIIRPDKYSDLNVEFSKFVKYICNEVEEMHIIWACVTSPLVNEDLYMHAMDIYQKKILSGYDSLVSVQKLQRYLLDRNGALNFRPGDRLKPINQLPDLYIFTNGISIAPRDSMIKWGYTSGDIPYMFELSKIESIDICDEFDYECAKKFYNDTNDSKFK